MHERANIVVQRVRPFRGFVELRSQPIDNLPPSPVVIILRVLPYDCGPDRGGNGGQCVFKQAGRPVAYDMDASEPLRRGCPAHTRGRPAGLGARKGRRAGCPAGPGSTRPASRGLGPEALGLSKGRFLCPTHAGCRPTIACPCRPSCRCRLITASDTMPPVAPGRDGNRFAPNDASADAGCAEHPPSCGRFRWAGARLSIRLQSRKTPRFRDTGRAQPRAPGRRVRARRSLGPGHPGRQPPGRDRSYTAAPEISGSTSRGDAIALERSTACRGPADRRRPLGSAPEERGGRCGGSAAPGRVCRRRLW